VNIETPEAIAEIEELMSRFALSAEQVVERVILEAGIWMPMELVGHEPHERLFSAIPKTGD
jgi:hypothetical protein